LIEKENSSFVKKSLFQTEGKSRKTMNVAFQYFKKHCGIVEGELFGGNLVLNVFFGKG
jgi:hypothetical protein